MLALVQVETKECLEAIDDVLSVPGINVAFLGEGCRQRLWEHPAVVCILPSKGLGGRGRQACAMLFLPNHAEGRAE
jgi:hypothetical protein